MESIKLNFIQTLVRLPVMKLDGGMQLDRDIYSSSQTDGSSFDIFGLLRRPRKRRTDGSSLDDTFIPALNNLEKLMSIDSIKSGDMDQLLEQIKKENPALYELIIKNYKKQ